MANCHFQDPVAAIFNHSDTFSQVAQLIEYPA